VEGAEQIALSDDYAAAIVYADRTDVAERLIADAVLTPHYDGEPLLVLLGDREEVGCSGRMGEMSERGEAPAADCRLTDSPPSGRQFHPAIADDCTPESC